MFEAVKYTYTCCCDLYFEEIEGKIYLELCYVTELGLR